MIADLDRARQLAVNEQRLVRRHVNLALATSLVHTAICAFYLWGGYFSASVPVFIGLFVSIWLGNIAMFLAVRSGLTRRLRDPGMPLGLALWLTTGFLISIYFVETPEQSSVFGAVSTDGFRISVMMVFFAAMLLASFRLNFWKLTALALYASGGYALVLLIAFADHGIRLSFTVEWLQWLIFSLTAAAFVVTGASINALRSSLSGKNEELGKALEMVREMAIRDELTGLFNRRHIMEILQQQQALADSGDYRFCLCYLDLDHFKPINDTYGHGVGDQVLRRFARLVHDSLREADYTGRLGGEEFVLVLSQTGLEEAWQVAERLRLSLEKQLFNDLHPDLRVTVSIGVSEYRMGEQIDDALNRADGCLYKAKDSGRNRVICERHLDSVASA
ncbi:MAG: GGDEF domain-containing protein [Alcanivoracaceae bacterium]|jgi:diguanylate cyclase (GGDEF)-like protein|nr:GGDEF domain-containing protein [Alcanivoracaceae bacterium]